MALSTCSAWQSGSITWPTGWGTSGRYKIISDREFVFNNKVYPAGRISDPIDQNWCALGTISVSGGVPTFSAFTLPQTDTGITPVGNSGEPTFTLVYYSAGNTKRGQLFQSWRIGASLTASFNFESLAIYNSSISVINPRTDFLGTDAINNLITARLYAPASTTQLGLLKTSVTPTDTASPVAVVINDPAIPAFVIHTSKYASLNAAKTAIDLLGGGTIVVDASTPITSNLSLTALTALRFEGQGILTGTSKTVAIAGPLESPPKRIFASGVTPTFVGNKSIPTYYPAWWVVGDGATDDTADAQKFLDAMQSGFHAVLTPGINIKNTGLTVTQLVNFTLEGLGGSDLADTGMPVFTYVGTNGGTHLHLVSCRGCVFKNFKMDDRGVVATNGPDISIWLDQDNSGNISSSDTIRGIMFEGPNRAGYISIKIDNASGTNNEQHMIDSVHGGSYGYGVGYGGEIGVGVYLGHTNVKEVTVQNSTFLGYAKGISGAGNPSCYSLFNNYTATAIALYGSTSDTLLSVGDHSEGSTQMMVITGSSAGAVTVIGARFADLHGGQPASGTTSTAPIISIPGITLEVRGSTFQSTTGSFNSNFISGPTDTGNLLWEHNTVSGITAADLITGINKFAYSRDDVRGNGLAIRGALVVGAGTGSALSGATPNINTPFSVRYNFMQGGATNVTNFTGGFDGQVIILEGDNLSTLINGATIKTISGGNIPPWGAGKIVVLMLNGTVWEQIGGVSLTDGSSIIQNSKVGVVNFDVTNTNANGGAQVGVHGNGIDGETFAFNTGTTLTAASVGMIASGASLNNLLLMTSGVDRPIVLAANDAKIATFSTTDLVLGNPTGVTRLKVTGVSNIKIGASTARGTTEGTNKLDIFNGTPPVGTLANGISLYSAAAELNVLDGAGNNTLLSPHDPITNEWIFYSKNTVTGRVLRIDMERLMRALNDLLGGDFIQDYKEPIE